MTIENQRCSQCGYVHPASGGECPIIAKRKKDALREATMEPVVKSNVELIEGDFIKKIKSATEAQIHRLTMNIRNLINNFKL